MSDPVTSTRGPATERPDWTPLRAAEYERERLRYWPWLTSVPLLGVSLSVNLFANAAPQRWNGAGPIDRAFGNIIAGTVDGRRRSSLTSDVLLNVLRFAPVVDALAWPAAEGERYVRNAYRLITLDVFAFSVRSVLTTGAKFAFRRARPFLAECEANADYDDGVCDSSKRNQSFFSGHTAAAFTGASLVCTHQRLRGWTAAGYVECASTLALATATGALRIVAERHFFSDVVVGALIGVLSGYVLPYLLYPRAVRPEPARIEARAW